MVSLLLDAASFFFLPNSFIFFFFRFVLSGLANEGAAEEGGIKSKKFISLESFEKRL